MPWATTTCRRPLSSYALKPSSIRNGKIIFPLKELYYVVRPLVSHHFGKSLGWFSNRMGTSVDNVKARGKDWTRLPVPNLPLCHWWSQLFDLRAPSSTDVPVLLLNQRIKSGRNWSCSRRCSLRKQTTFHDATTCFPAKWRLRNERRNSILMTRHYPDLGSASHWSCRVGNLLQPVRSTTQIWAVLLIDRAAWEICFNQSEALPRSGQCFSLIVPRGKFASTSQKHYPDLGNSLFKDVRAETISVNVLKWRFRSRHRD